MTTVTDAAFSPSPAVREALEAAQLIGAIGPGDLSTHIAHASAFVAAVLAVEPAADDEHRRVLDLGSGGGLPGLVVADRVPKWAVTLLDGRTERVRFLQETVDRLGWSARVQTVAQRAELAAHEASYRSNFDVVMARSFAAPAVTAECAAGFLAPGGLLVVSEPPSAGRRRWPPDGCALLGLAVLPPPNLSRAFALLRAETPCSERYPRRVGVPSKRPLFGENRP